MVTPPTSTTVINFSTYLGNDLTDVARDVAFDSSGNVYVVGGALSANLLPGTPVRAFVPGPGMNAFDDAFVAKFNTTGQVQWWTFLGGPGPDRAHAVEVDADGNVVIGGAAANLFPVTPGAVLTEFQGGAGACDPNQAATAGTGTSALPPAAVCVVDTANPAQDGFVAKLDGATGALVWATYFGSGKFQQDTYLDDTSRADDDNVTDFNDDADPRSSVVRDLAVDRITRDIYLTFSVNSRFIRADDGIVDPPDVTTATTRLVTVTEIGPVIRNLPPVILAALAGGDRATLPGLDAAISGIDGILAKLAPDGASLAWATYVGGIGDESIASSVRLDLQGNPIVLYTSSNPNRVRTQKLGTTTTTSTVTTGTPPVTVTTTTMTTTLVVDETELTTKNAYDATPAGQDFYLAQYPMLGGPMIWATFLGGIRTEKVESVNFAVRTDGTLVVAAESDSPDFPLAGQGFDPSFNGGFGSTAYGSEDCVIATIAPGVIPTTGQLLAATYYGGASGEGCAGVAVDSQNRIYVTGGSASSDLPLKGGPHQSQRPGPRSAFLAVFSADLRTLLHGGYFGGTGLGASNALLIRSDSASSAFVVIAGAAGAGYPLSAMPARGTVTAPPEHGVLSDLTIQLTP